MTESAGRRSTFTEEVRQELSRLPLGARAAQRAELAALLRLGGDAEDAVPGVWTRAGSVARRTYALLVECYGVRPEVLVRAAVGEESRSTYGVRVTAGGRRIAEDLGLSGQRGDGSRRRPPADEEALTAYLRGAVLAAGSISTPGRPPHLEIAVGTAGLATDLAGRLSEWLEATVTAVPDRDRVVVKSGETIGDILARIGATNAYLRWEERRLRGEVRAEATRLANADAANLRRTIEAAAEQTRTVEDAIARVGWKGLEEDLRQVALARLANPSASLAELGELCDPPVGKSAVHRRLRRLEAVAREVDDTD